MPEYDDPQVTSAEQWERVKAAFEAHALGNDHVAAGGFAAPHYAPTLTRRVLWFAVLPLGPELVPGNRPYTTREGATLTARGARRAAARTIERHLAGMDGRDPYADTLQRAHLGVLAAAAVLFVVQLALLLEVPRYAATAAAWLMLVAGLVLGKYRLRRARRYQQPAPDPPG